MHRGYSRPGADTRRGRREPRRRGRHAHDDGPAHLGWTGPSAGTGRGAPGLVAQLEPVSFSRRAASASSEARVPSLEEDDDTDDADVLSEPEPPEE